jgi:hypothetical protein
MQIDVGFGDRAHPDVVHADDFAVVLASISEFLAPVFQSILKSKPINTAWRAGGPWNDS